MKFSGVFIACVNAASESTGDQARVLSSPYLPVGLKCSNTEAQRIINGFTANKEAWPFMARFQKKGAFKHYCGGVIIADNWVLSASHCFQRSSSFVVEDYYKTLKVWFGDYHLHQQDAGEFSLSPTNIIFHDDADLALVQVPSLKANAPSDCDNCFDFACLPTEHVEHGAGCHTAGWGYISADKTAKILQEVNINAMSDQYCVDHSRFYLRPRYRPYATDSDILEVKHEFCAGVLDEDEDGETDGGRDACQGDSGGPLICPRNGQPIIQGIVSRGWGCAMKNAPGIYTRVSAMTQWIEDTMASYSPPADDVEFDEEETTTTGYSTSTTIITTTVATTTTVEEDALLTPEMMMDIIEGKVKFPNVTAKKKQANLSARRKKSMAALDAFFQNFLVKGLSKNCATSHLPLASPITGARSSSSTDIIKDGFVESIRPTYENCGPWKNWIRAWNIRVRKLDALINVMEQNS